MWLLEFLLAQVSAVFDWFGVNYWLFRTWIASLPYILSQIPGIVYAAINNFIGSIGTAISNFYQAVILPFIQAVYNYAVGILQKLNAYG